MKKCLLSLIVAVLGMITIVTGTLYASEIIDNVKIRSLVIHK
ncbi:Uncharacterized protein dnm_097890 [Desulfonema magnum]|uniref:Uncharacterized protein n=1 Tax=Desulfonema magnum TaxID=45655 RepID=A0A975BZK9_9BACT|nr:Uncharacterized protein dnm_097890 [Desulfonema magnum]